LNHLANDIFRRGSTTFYNSSRFFPAGVRDDVTTLYAFVRLADDYVDCRPQQPEALARLRHDYERAIAGGPADDAVVAGFVRLALKHEFDPAWAGCFLDTMAQDLRKARYETIEETLEYVHGSAEVIGLMMARILRLPREADGSAALLGRAFQYLNFIRDIAEDNALGRTYLPLEEARAAGLESLEEQCALAHPDAFRSFVTTQLGRYHEWRRQAERGFAYIPRATLVPIVTAARLYDGTAGTIAKDPFVIFRRKVKPSRWKAMLTAVSAMIGR
jgi:phytoene synthase